MPNSDSNGEGVLIIKLKNGYNIGIRFDSSLSIKKLAGRRETFEFPKVKIDENSKLPESHANRHRRDHRQQGRLCHGGRLHAHQTGGAPLPYT